MGKSGFNLRMIALLGACVMLASCSNDAVPQSGSDAAQQSGSAEQTGTAAPSGTAASEDANYIQLSGSTARFTGTGAVVRDDEIQIALPGVYVVSGQWDNGRIVVDLERKGTVQLVLSGADIRHKSSAPIYVVSASETIITLQEGTENFITDGAKYVYENAGDDEPSAAIYSKDDLIIDGAGALTVNANYNDGITGRDDLRIAGGKITVNAADDGIVGRDLLEVTGGQLFITADGDGLKSTNDKDADRGTIRLEGGSYTIIAGSDGIQAENDLLISGGEFSITSGGGVAQASGSSNDESGKGLKAGAAIAITGGTLLIDAVDDAVHSNGSIEISGGDMTVRTGDDAIHADTSALVTGGTVTVEQSYEGLEGENITIAGGTVRITSRDDGVNVAGGADGSGFRGPGQQAAGGSEGKLSISGGYLVVNTSGDGLDANGSIAMSGGTVIVHGPASGGNGSLDYDGIFDISGGLLVAAGSSGMAEAPSPQSSQPSILMTYSQTQRAGTIVHLENSAGEAILTFAPAVDYQTVVISSPELKQGEAYTLYTGGSASGAEADGLYTDGSYQDGKALVSFTLADSVTYVNESGVTTKQGGGFGGRGGRGGR